MTVGMGAADRIMVTVVEPGLPNAADAGGMAEFQDRAATQAEGAGGRRVGIPARHACEPPTSGNPTFGAGFY